jgi:CubicO group peptidase (beta-lactamase class C family)
VETPLPIASGSKWLIAATIMTLVDEGLVGLDVPIGRYLPSFTGEKGAITLRQLLSHTSGLPAGQRSSTGAHRDLEKTVDRLGRQVRLTSSPGTRFCYGNLSFKVAARIAEVATCKPWHHIFAERVAEPLGMRHTAFSAHGLGRSINNAKSSVADFAEFLTMFQNEGVSALGRRVLSKEAVNEMIKSHTDGLEMGCVNGMQHARAERTEYGLGVWREHVDPITKRPAAVSHFGYPGFRGVINYRHGYVTVLAVQGQKPWVKRYIRRRFTETLALVDRFVAPSP